jgi:hypothetical protein
MAVEATVPEVKSIIYLYMPALPCQGLQLVPQYTTIGEYVVIPCFVTVYKKTIQGLKPPCAAAEACLPDGAQGRLSRACSGAGPFIELTWQPEWCIYLVNINYMLFMATRVNAVLCAATGQTGAEQR